MTKPRHFRLSLCECKETDGQDGPPGESQVPQVGSKSTPGGKVKIPERDPREPGRAPMGSLQGEWVVAGK